MSEHKQTYDKARATIIGAINQFISEVDKDGFGHKTFNRLDRLIDLKYVTRVRFSESDYAALQEFYKVVNNILTNRAGANWSTRPELAALLQEFLNEQSPSAPNNGVKSGANTNSPPPGVTSDHTEAPSVRAAFNARASSQEIPEPEYKSAKKRVLLLMRQVIEAPNNSDIANNISELLIITSQELNRTENIPESEIARLHPLYQEIRRIITSSNTSSNAAAEQHQRGSKFLRANRARMKTEYNRLIDAMKKEFRRLLDNQPDDRPQQKPSSLRRNYAAAAVDNRLARSPNGQKKTSNPQGSTDFQVMATNCKNLLNLMHRYILTPKQRSEILKEILRKDYIPVAVKPIEEKYLTIFTDLRDAMLNAAKLGSEEERVNAFEKILRQRNDLYKKTPSRGSGPGAPRSP